MQISHCELALRYNSNHTDRREIGETDVLASSATRGRRQSKWNSSPAPSCSSGSSTRARSSVSHRLCPPAPVPHPCTIATQSPPTSPSSLTMFCCSDSSEVRASRGADARLLAAVCVFVRTSLRLRAASRCQRRQVRLQQREVGVEPGLHGLHRTDGDRPVRVPHGERRADRAHERPHARADVELRRLKEQRERRSEELVLEADEGGAGAGAGDAAAAAAAAAAADDADADADAGDAASTDADADIDASTAPSARS
eukprot:1491329-Pleurochrysis_carterae.AAC.1